MRLDNSQAVCLQDNAAPDHDATSLSVEDGLRRAMAELAAVRRSAEESFEMIRLHSGAHALDDPATIVAMQSVDSISQHLAAIETYLGNLASVTHTLRIDQTAAARGITLSAVVDRLVTHRKGPATQASGTCEFF
ncbi:MAG: hypothetical protein JWL93_976 [Hyphomicrobiales bacterium]|jgi:hypothetical protein|nr:hypothetical protein [Hyphomicrobiales bacterium]